MKPRKTWITNLKRKRRYSNSQIDSSTINGNVEFVQSQYKLYSDVTSVNSVFVSDTIISHSDDFRIKCLSYGEISAILCVLYFLYLHFFILSW